MTDDEAESFRHVLAKMADVPVERIWWYRPKPESKPIKERAKKPEKVQQCLPAS